MPIPNCQSYGRMPQPCCTSGLTRVVTRGLPKLELFQTPQLSPPDVRLFCAARFLRSQAGMKFLLPSVQLRVVVCWKVTAGLLIVYWLPFCAVSRYLLMFTFRDVLRVPKRSYAAPIRGVMSWKPVN